MKFMAGIAAYLLIGLILAWGVLLMMAGKPLLLIAAVLVYIVAFGKIGCMSH